MRSSKNVVLITLLILALGALAACSTALEELASRIPLPAKTAAPEAVPVVSIPPPSEAHTALSLLELVDVPQRDLVALAQRFQKVGEISAVATDTPRRYAIGDEELFWIVNSDTNDHRQITAVLQYITPHLYMWLEQGAAVNLDALRASADLFESHTYLANRRIFGSEWSPGVDGDVHLHVLHARGLGAGTGGYYWSADEHPRQVHEYSNEREMFYANLDTVAVGSAYYDGMLAHEFQHMIHWHMDLNEDLWVNEGLAELAAFVNGFDVGSVADRFLAQPDLQLTDFRYDVPSGSSHYGVSFLFTLYFWERYGEQAVRALVEHPANGAAAFNAVLAQQQVGVDLGQLFADWAAALWLDDPDLGDGRYGFRSIDLVPPALSAEVTEFPTPLQTGTVSQFASDYIYLAGAEPVTVYFTGTTQVRLINTAPHGGDAFWWSNRGDAVDSTLTRRFDLTGVERATLDYWLWYDIEQGWDYAYLAVSIDEGQTWETIQTPHTSDEDRTGNNLGHGYTGKSGGGQTSEWIHEQVDLSAHVGRTILVRFEYVTDDAVNNAGLALDDLAIPELDYVDGFESDDPAWAAAGFVRTNNALPQTYIVQLVELGAKPRVSRLTLNEQRRARWSIPLSADMNQAILIISATTPVTLEPAGYTFRISQD